MKIGLQLYSVREELAKDMDGTLKQVKEMGYDYVEFAGYHGHTPEEVRELLDKHGLKCISVHQTYGIYLEDFENGLKTLNTLGAKYSAIPWMDPSCHAGGENHEKTMPDIQKIGKKLSENGIAFLYHNHDFEYKTCGDKTCMDIFYEMHGSDVINPEFDVCWVTFAGYKPEEEIKKYADRISIIHLKDFTVKSLGGGPVYDLIDDNGATENPTKEDMGFEFKPIGSGMVDFDKVFKAAEESSAEYFIVEQDNPTAGKTPLECAKLSREFLRSKGY